MRKVEVFIEGRRLDLFEDESINLNRSVQDIKDISKIYTDFTQTFTVPASKNNNKIFRHFEIPEVDNSYDTRIKKDGSITIASLDFLTGKIRLEGVNTENGKPQSYRITFFGSLVSLKDILGEDKLNTLDWLSQFDHDYTYANIKSGLEDALYFDVEGLQEDVIRYPLLSSEKRYIYSSAPNQETETISNISYIKDAYPESNNGFLWTDLKPSIGLKHLIKAIEVKYNITFGGNFFSKEEFAKMQMWLSNEKGRAKMSAEGQKFIDFEDATYFSEGYLNFVIPISAFGRPPDYYTYKVTITPLTEDPYELVVYNYNSYVGLNFPTGFARYEKLTGEQVLEGEVRTPSGSNFGSSWKLGYFIEAENVDSFDVHIEVKKWQHQTGGYVDVETVNTQRLDLLLNAEVKILQQMPDMLIAEFLSGLFKMFNLTIVPNNDKLEIYNLQEWYNLGRIIDVSKYIDKTKTPIDRGQVLSGVDFKFKNPESFLISNFYRFSNRYFGDTSYVFRDDAGNKADGEKMEINLPFEQMIYERLIEGVVYGYVVDKDREPYNIDTHLLYVVPTNTVNSISIIDDQGNAQELTTYNRPSHRGGFGLTGYSTTFSNDFDEYTNTGLNENLLTNYYLDYISDVFSKKTRIFNYEARFSNNLIRTIKLNDRLVIDGRRFIINNMNINLFNRKVQLELINDIYRGETQESLTTKMIFSSYSAEYLATGGGSSFTYQTNEQINPVVLIELMDLGYGTSWISYTHTGNLIEYSLTENTTGVDRYTAIKLTGFSGSETYHKIKQNG